MNWDKANKLASNILIGTLLGCGIVYLAIWLTTNKSKTQTVKNAQDICVEQAMQSDSKRQTAKLAAAVYLQRTDQAHLIKYIDLKEAVKAVYCSK